MIPLQSKNLFIIDDKTSTFALKSIIDFYELSGKNILFLSHYYSSLFNILNCSKRTTSLSSFEKTVSDNSFRLDLIVLEVTSSNIFDFHNKIIKTSNLPFIFISKTDSRSIITDLFEEVYVISSKYSNGSSYAHSIHSKVMQALDLSNHSAHNLRNGITIDLESLKKQYIRDEKIKSIFNNPKSPED